MIEQDDGLLRSGVIHALSLAHSLLPNSPSRDKIWLALLYLKRTALASRDDAKGTADIARCIETVENAYSFIDGAVTLKKCGEWIYLKELLTTIFNLIIGHGVKLWRMLKNVLHLTMPPIFNMKLKCLIEW